MLRSRELIDREHWSEDGMEMRALRYFVAVAEEQHFGRAAERLHIVQPAVSQQIAKLEREIGVVLLDRSSRRVRLTGAGERVLPVAREALAAADRVAAAAREPGTVLRIGTAPALTERLERAVAALRADNPTGETVLVDLPDAARLEAVRQGHLDVALVRGTVSAPGLTVVPLWTEPLHAVVAVTHPHAGRPGTTLAALSHGPLITLRYEVDPPVHDAARRALAAAGVRPALGWTAGSVQDVVVGVGSDPQAWALLPPELLAISGARRVRGVRLDPEPVVTGSLVASPSRPEGCVEALVAAFGDAPNPVHQPATLTTAT